MADIPPVSLHSRREHRWVYLPLFLCPLIGKPCRQQIHFPAALIQGVKTIHPRRPRKFWFAGQFRDYGLKIDSVLDNCFDPIYFLNSHLILDCVYSGFSSHSAAPRDKFICIHVPDFSGRIARSIGIVNNIHDFCVLRPLITEPRTEKRRFCPPVPGRISVPISPFFRSPRR